MKAHLIEEEILQRRVTAQVARREGVGVRTVRRWKEPSACGEMPEASGAPGRVEACDRYLANVEAVNPAGADLGATFIAERQAQRREQRVERGALTWMTARAELARTIGSMIDTLIGEAAAEVIEMKLLHLQAVASRALSALGLRREPLPPARQINS